MVDTIELNGHDLDLREYKIIMLTGLKRNVNIVLESFEQVIKDNYIFLNGLCETDLVGQVDIIFNRRCVSESYCYIQFPEAQLHPSEQRLIISELLNVKPHPIYIIYTHSPIILQSLEGMCMYVDCDKLLSKDVDAYVPRYGDFSQDYKSVEDILIEDFHVETPTRSAKWCEMVETAKKYYTLLEDVNSSEMNNEEIKSLKCQLDMLIEPYSNSPAYVALLQMKRVSKGITVLSDLEEK